MGSARSFYRFTSIFISQDVSRSFYEKKSFWEENLREYYHIVILFKIEFFFQNGNGKLLGFLLSLWKLDQLWTRHMLLKNNTLSVISDISWLTCYCKTSCFWKDKSPVVWSCPHVYGSYLKSAIVTAQELWQGTQFIFTWVKLIQLGVQLQDCQSQCKHREKADSSFSSTSCSLLLTKCEIAPWVSLCLFQKNTCLVFSPCLLCVCTELGKWLVVVIKVVSLYKLKNRAKQTPSLVCNYLYSTDSAVILNAFCQTRPK